MKCLLSIVTSRALALANIRGASLQSEVNAFEFGRRSVAVIVVVATGVWVTFLTDVTFDAVLVDAIHCRNIAVVIVKAFAISKALANEIVGTVFFASVRRKNAVEEVIAWLAGQAIRASVRGVVRKLHAKGRAFWTVLVFVAHALSHSIVDGTAESGL